jgi:hypothetical protein
MGYKYAVRMTTDSFTVSAASAPVANYAPPGDDTLDIHFQVRNVLTDRPAEFQLDTVGIFGACAAFTGPAAPNGQCSLGTASEFARYVPSNTVDPQYGVDVPLASGATQDFHVYDGLPTTFKYTDWTVWYTTCAGDGTLNSKLTGGDHLLPAGNG